MKNKKIFLVIGNPIKHSLSPFLHNYWFKKNRLNCEYKKLKINQSGIRNILNKVRSKKIEGLNVYDLAWGLKYLMPGPRMSLWLGLVLEMGLPLLSKGHV